MTPIPEPSCGWCGAELVKGATGPAPKYCSDAHRLRAADARRIAAKQLDRHNERARAVAVEAAELAEE